MGLVVFVSVGVGLWGRLGEGF